MAAPNFSVKCSDSPLSSQSPHNLDTTYDKAQPCTWWCRVMSQDTLVMQIHFTQTTLLRVITQCTHTHPNTHHPLLYNLWIHPSHTDGFHTEVGPRRPRTSSRCTDSPINTQTCSTTHTNTTEPWASPQILSQAFQVIDLPHDIITPTKLRIHRNACEYIDFSLNAQNCNTTHIYPKIEHLYKAHEPSPICRHTTHTITCAMPRFPS